MKLYQLFRVVQLQELFPPVSTMFPNANLHRDVFQKHWMLCSIQPVMSKNHRYELMEDLVTKNNDSDMRAKQQYFQHHLGCLLGQGSKKRKGC